MALDFTPIIKRLDSDLRQLKPNEVTTLDKLINKLGLPLQQHHKIIILNNLTNYLQDRGLYLNFSPYRPEKLSQFLTANFTLRQADHLLLYKTIYDGRVSCGKLKADVKELFAFDTHAIFKRYTSIHTTQNRHADFQFNSVEDFSDAKRELLTSLIIYIHQKYQPALMKQVPLRDFNKYTQISLNNQPYLIPNQDPVLIKLQSLFESNLLQSSNANIAANIDYYRNLDRQNHPSQENFNSDLNSYIVHCNATNFKDASKELLTPALCKLSADERVIALPPNCKLDSSKGKVRLSGDNKFLFVIENSTLLSYQLPLNRKFFYSKVQSPEQLMNFMNRYILYGWVDSEGDSHIANTKSIHSLYRINSLEQVFTTGLATCIEQVKLEHDFFTKNHIPHQILCYYRQTDAKSDKIEMHCFIIYKRADKIYYFEHSDRSRRGIHAFDKLADALKFACDPKHNTNFKLCEINEPADNMSFADLQNYLNELPNIPLN